jgi:hypothetical protein
VSSVEQRLLADLADSLERRLKRKIGDERHWPQPLCQIGEWIGKRENYVRTAAGWGAPCAERCAQDRARLAAAHTYLAEQAHQLERAS